MRRQMVVAAFLVLLTVAFVRIPSGGQGAVSLSRPGHEDLTFWVNHNGLEQIDVEGEVGFGDMARILLRRRENTARIRKLRDRFTFRVQEMAALDTPDVFRAEISERGTRWLQKPGRFVAAQGRIFNLPIIVKNNMEREVPVELSLSTGSKAKSTVAANGASGFFLKATASARLTVNEISADFAMDTRPLVKTRVFLLDENGHPAAARVYVTGSDGLAYTARGSSNRITAMSAEYYFHVSGEFALELPAGPALLEATRGTEYELASQSVDLQPGKPAEVRLQLRRWENMAKKGWYSSDAHIHANYTAPHHQVITPQDVRLQTLAEDLNNANMMVANSSGSFIHDEKYFSGGPHSLSLPNYIIYWNEEMRNAGLYGHMCLYGLKQLVHPIYSGFRDTPQWEDYPPNYAQAAATRKQGGAVTYAHPGYAPTFEVASARELPVDLALGEVDAMDVLSNNDENATMELWYRLLNCGFRLGISAGTDAFTNVSDHYIAGGGRVYVKGGNSLDYAEWISGYKRGRSFASNGPVILFTADGKEAGDELRFDDSSATVRVKAAVHTQVPLEKVEVIVNGKVEVSRPVQGKLSIELDERIPLKRSSWIAVRALGPWHRLVLNDAQAFAHTSPVYVYLGNQPIAFRSDLAFYMDWIERLIARVKERGRFETPERRQEVVDLFLRALDVYRKAGASATD